MHIANGNVQRVGAMHHVVHLRSIARGAVVPKHQPPSRLSSKAGGM